MHCHVGASWIEGQVFFFTSKLEKKAQTLTSRSNISVRTSSCVLTFGIIGCVFIILSRSTYPVSRLAGDMSGWGIFWCKYHITLEANHATSSTVEAHSSSQLAATHPHSESNNNTKGNLATSHVFYPGKRTANSKYYRPPNKLRQGDRWLAKRSTTFIVHMPGIT